MSDEHPFILDLSKFIIMSQCNILVPSWTIFEFIGKEILFWFKKLSKVPPPPPPHDLNL